MEEKKEICPHCGERLFRCATGTRELDRVLGGGLIQGAAVLITGEAAVGKTTLALQTAFLLADADVEANEDPSNKIYDESPIRVLYANPDDNEVIVRKTLERIGNDNKRDNLTMVCGKRGPLGLVAEVLKHDPDVLIYDQLRCRCPGECHASEIMYDLKDLTKKRGMYTLIMSTPNESEDTRETADVIISMQLMEGGVRALRRTKNSCGKQRVPMGRLLLKADGLHSLEAS